MLLCVSACLSVGVWVSFRLKNLVIKDITMYILGLVAPDFRAYMFRFARLNSTQSPQLLCQCIFHRKIYSPFSHFPPNQNKKLFDSRLTVFKLVRRKLLIARVFGVSTHKHSIIESNTLFFIFYSFGFFMAFEKRKLCNEHMCLDKIESS